MFKSTGYHTSLLVGGPSESPPAHHLNQEDSDCPNRECIYVFPISKAPQWAHSRRNNFKLLSRQTKDIGHVEFCLFNFIFLCPKTHNLISNYCSVSSNTRSCHVVPSSQTIFFFSGRHSEILQILYYLLIVSPVLLLPHHHVQCYK